MTTQWIGADGTTVLFDGTSGYTLLEGALGLHAPPYELTLAGGVSFDGATQVKERRAQRRIVLPILIVEPSTGAGVGGRMSTLLRSFARSGVLRYVPSDRYLLSVRYESGAEQTATEQDPNTRSDDVVPFQLVALDPWWYDAESSAPINTDQATDFDDPDVDFDDPGVAFNGSSSTTITVEGDTSVLPLWTITGPYSLLTVGVEDGQQFTLAAPLAAGDVITVDTRPGNRGPRLNGGPVDWSLLTPDSRLWELPAGSPAVIAGATGTDGDSAVEVTFRQRWLTP
jgi:hypothetical protein